MKRSLKTASLILLTTLATLAMPARADDKNAAAAEATAKLFRRDNLVAWCIVPFDSKKRGPVERVAMLERLGFRREGTRRGFSFEDDGIFHDSAIYGLLETDRS